jgi:hypothetical protein
MHLQAWHAMTYYQRITEETWQPPEEPNSRQFDPRTGEVASSPTWTNETTGRPQVPPRQTTNSLTPQVRVAR